MNHIKIMEYLHEFEKEIIKIRRILHEHPEIGFEMKNTKKIVFDELKNMGYSPLFCGKAGIIANTEKKPGKTFLLRADMDALPIKEKTNLNFSSQNNNMHACGHDMHTAMLLGAALLLKKHEKELKGTVRLMFQPAEEILEGANDMIKNGVLENVDAAMMIHVMAGLDIPTGTTVISSPGICSPSADYFKITVKGTGSHSSMPHNGRDAINISAYITTALNEINSRELSLNEKALITIGTITSGTSINSISDYSEMNGIMRCYDESTRLLIKSRITEISENIAKAFKGNATVTFGSGCPSFINDTDLSSALFNYNKELSGEAKCILSEELSGKSAKASGSEDFAYVSQKIPSIMLMLSAGSISEGYKYSQHHPEVVFNEKALIIGSAVYAYSAMRWLEDNFV